MIGQKEQRGFIQFQCGCSAGSFCLVCQIFLPVIFGKFSQFGIDEHLFKGITAPRLFHHFIQFVSGSNSFCSRQLRRYFAQHLQFLIHHLFNQFRIDYGERNVTSRQCFQRTFHRRNQSRSGIFKDIEFQKLIDDLLNFVGMFVIMGFLSA